MKILLFGVLREVVGQAEIDLDQGDQLSTVFEVEAHLLKIYPDLEKQQPYWRVALNHEYCDKSVQVGEDSEIAFIPPVSGG